MTKFQGNSRLRLNLKMLKPFDYPTQQAVLLGFVTSTQPTIE